jgi:hypothetical protein
MIVVESAVKELVEVLERNPFPGERRKVVDLACELFPEAEVILQPKVFTKGRKFWEEVFEIGGIDCRERVWFPVKVEEVNIETVERKLREVAKKEDRILAKIVPQVLEMNANSKQYREVKKKLEERGWKWKQVKNKREVMNYVFLPK